MAAPDDIDEEELINEEAQPIVLDASPRPAVVAPPPVAAAPTLPVAAPGVAPVTAPYNPAPNYNPALVGQDIAMQRMLRSMGDAPIAEAEAAVATALKFQATRGYQRDLANGVSPAEALTKWAPMMFTAPKASNLGQAAALVRAGRGGPDKVMDIGGQGFLYDPSTKSMKALTPAKVVAPPVDRFALQSHADLLKEIRDSEAKLDDPSVPLDTKDNLRDFKLPALHAEERAMRARFMGGQPAAPVTAPAAPAKPATTGKVRVKNPQGKIGYIPASQLDDALGLGYTRM